MDVLRSIHLPAFAMRRQGECKREIPYGCFGSEQLQGILK